MLEVEPVESLQLYPAVSESNMQRAERCIAFENLLRHYEIPGLDSPDKIRPPLAENPSALRPDHP